MGEEQRAAQRIDLAEPVQAKVGDVAAKIVDLSLVGCRIEHAEKLSMGATLPLSFEWRGEPVRMTVKVARTELRSSSGKMMYSTGIQFAPSVDSSPEVVQRIMGSLIKKSVEEHAPAEVPIFFERAPFFRDDEPGEPPPAAPPAPPARPPAAPPPAARATTPAPAPAPPPASVPMAVGVIALSEGTDDGGPSYELDFNPAATATHMDAHVETVIATQSFELDTDDAEAVADEHQHQPAGQSFELEGETEERYVRCTFEDGQ
ncbi:MAG: PilZ domain-containing protein, partial [Thermoanaerobaculia bacterium]